MPTLALALPYLTQKPLGGGSGGGAPANSRYLEDATVRNLEDATPRTTEA
jgi:hypothetical protein